jgi:DNA (cytosine-5)-methyltransferase 1
MRIVRSTWSDLAPGAETKEVRRPLARPLRGMYLRPEHRQEVPDSTDPQAVREWVSKDSGLTAVDLFCGAGGLSLGLHDAGFRVLVGADSDLPSTLTHEANLGSLSYHGDLSDSASFLRQIRAWGIERVDLVAGGVPCQPFSRAGRSKIRSLVDEGRRPATDPRASLWKSFIQIVTGLQPRAVLLENVPDLAVWNEGAVLAGLCESLQELGYSVDARLLNAFDYQVPQHRSRLILIATRPGVSFSWPAEVGRTTVRDAIGDLPQVPPAHTDAVIPYEQSSSWFQRRLRRDLRPEEDNKLFDHITRDVRPDDAEAYSLMVEGGTYKDLPARLQRYRADIFDDKYKRLSWDGLSRTVTAHIAKDGYWYIHPSQDRTLSVREAARIQTFPDWFRFAGTRSHQFKQIGNAVPPLLAEAVGRELIRALSGHRGVDTSPGASFRAELERWHEDNRRDLPWRVQRDPWLVLIGEMCLRRTSPARAGQLLPRIAQIAPDPSSFAETGEPGAIELRRLGVRRSSDHLLAVARAIVADHHGAVPDTAPALLTLPHVGTHIAAAVLAYGHGLRAMAMDTDTSRLARRMRGTTRTWSAWQGRVDLQRLAGTKGADASYNSALSDLAASVCIPAAPRCPSCPIRDHCATASNGISRLSPAEADWHPGPEIAVVG